MSSLADTLKQPIDALNLSVRSHNCVKKNGVCTIADLVQRTAGELSRLPNLGKKSLSEIEEVLRKRGLRLGMVLDDHLEVREAPRVVTAQAAVPEAISESADSAERPPTVLDSRPVEIRVLEYLKQLSPRDLAVLRERVLSDDLTLREVGERFDVTRERIRQIERKLRRQLHAYIGGVDGEPIRAYADSLLAAIGAAVPEGQLQSYCDAEVATSISSHDDRSIVTGFLLWAAGPYRRRKGWATLPDYSASAIRNSLEQLLDDRGWLSPFAAAEGLTQANVRSGYHAEWLRDHGFRQVDGGWLPNLRSIPDQAVQLITYRGGPVLASEVAELAKSGSERSVRQRLLDDPRLKRITRQAHFVLRDWNEYDEYSGIAAEIAEEIERQGGAATPEHLVEALSHRYGVKPHSVLHYISAPRFTRTSEGMVRLRTPDEELQVSADPKACPGLYMVEGRWRLRIEVTKDTLRGSGRTLQPAVALLVGCQPGGRCVLRSSADEIVFSWPSGSVRGNIGSVKPDIDVLGGMEGDYAFLELRGDHIDVSLLRAAELSGLSPRDRLARLVGLSVLPPPDSAWDDIGHAIGLAHRPIRYSADEVHAALMRRNEVKLADVIRDETSLIGDDIFASLEKTLGL